MFQPVVVVEVIERKCIFFLFIPIEFLLVHSMVYHYVELSVGGGGGGGGDMYSSFSTD